MNHSRTFSAVKADHNVDFAFGTYAPEKVWRRGVGGGYREPVNRRSDNHLAGQDFRTWMERWTSPESTTRPLQHIGDMKPAPWRLDRPTPAAVQDRGSPVLSEGG